MARYRDRWIECTDTELRIRGYYFPWGTRRIAYGTIRSVRRVRLTAMRGRWRIWGTASPRYWASLDPAPRKADGLVLDVGGFVRPFITPDDCDAVQRILEDAAGAAATSRDASPGPIV